MKTAEGARQCVAGSEAEFLIERYTAYTGCKGTSRFFRVWHEPWQQSTAEVTMRDFGLLASTGNWFNGARLIGGHYSKGARDVWMSRPHRTVAPSPRRRLTAFFDL
jgi:uncharacterized protein YqjF (DUF2071 family)